MLEFNEVEGLGMVEHVGQGCGLSFLIVAAFAVLLHEREPAPPPPEAKPQAPAAVEEPPRPASPPATRSPLVVTTPPVPKSLLPRAPKSAEPGGLQTAHPIPPPRVATVVSPPSRPVASKPAPPIPRPQRRPTLRDPESDFTQVGAGETLEGIATRVYGSSEAVEMLWRANRDQVVVMDRPLESGIWLRTPPCPGGQARPGRR